MPIEARGGGETTTATAPAHLVLSCLNRWHWRPWRRRRRRLSTVQYRPSEMEIVFGLKVPSSDGLCPIHVVTFTLISNLATDCIQKRTGQALLFFFEYNLSPNLISN